MAFSRPQAAPPKPPRARGGAIGRIAGTLAFAVLLWLAALFPYDRLTPAPQGYSDLVPFGPGDPPIRTVADLSKAYGISAAAESHFRVDQRGVHDLRRATPAGEEHE